MTPVTLTLLAGWVDVRPVIIVLLLAVGIFVALRPQFGTTVGERVESGRRKAMALCAVGAIGLYDGIFGPGTGMFLIMAFTGIFAQSFLQLAAMAKVVNTATNLGGYALLALVVVLSAKLVLVG